MSKHTAALAAVYLLLDSQAWKDESITAMPPNFQGSLETEGEYIRVSVLNSRPKPHYGAINVLGGMVMIDIFIPQGSGIHRTHEIADILDSLFQAKWSNEVQFGASALQQLGRDTANTGLHRAIYSIPFTYYGE
jgi:hypothetical protein